MQNIENNKGNVYVRECPFCGKIPHYDEKSELVHCETLDCAVGDFYIHIEEWNYRYNDQK